MHTVSDMPPERPSLLNLTVSKISCHLLVVYSAVVFKSDGFLLYAAMYNYLKSYVYRRVSVFVTCFHERVAIIIYKMYMVHT